MVHGMEKELGVKLFDRRMDGVSLSEEGKKLYGHTSDVVRDMQRLREACAESGGRELLVSAITDSRLTEVFAGYCNMKRNKSSRFQYLEASMEDIMRHVRRHVSEVGLVYVPQWAQTAFLSGLEHKSLEFVRLKQGRWYKRRNNDFLMPML